MSNRNKINPAIARQQRQALIKDRMRKKLAVTKGPKKICVIGIMRNESKNVDRLLDSLLPLPPDMISIVDTGSTDNTAEKILSWGKKHKIPTTVHHEPFRDFAYNRTHSFQIAKKTYPEADYFLLTDADFVWEVNKGSKFDKSLLIDHKYLIEQYNKSLGYWNVRMLSARVDFECIGLTHEFWKESTSQSEYNGEIRTAKITTLVIDDKEDGGCKTDKFERDERLLRKGLDDPKTPNYLKTRYKFYLAQTLKDMGRYAESIVWYTKRVEDKGWPEEVYYSQFQIGFNYEQLGWRTNHCVSLQNKDTKTDDELKYIATWNPDNNSASDLSSLADKYFSEAADNYLAAYNYRKIRAESLYHLVRMYRLLGKNELAYTYAIIGNTIKYPVDDTLFIERACYSYKFDYEISVVAYYLPDHRDSGREACSRLLQRDDLPDWMKNNVESNSRHYI